MNYKKKYLKYKNKYLKLKYDGGSTNTNDSRLTEQKTLEKAQYYKKEQDDINKQINNSKTTRSILYIAKSGAQALKILPGGFIFAGVMEISYQMARAYTTSLKFKEVINDTMIILANCYKILMLINHSSDIFLIAIHNWNGLDKLFNKLKELQNNENNIINLEIEFNTIFDNALDIAKQNKIINRNNIQNNNKYVENHPLYLLYNIHPSHELMEQIKLKMEILLKLLLNCAPNSVILSLFLDKTLKDKGFGDLIANECILRRTIIDGDNKTYCIKPNDYITNKENIEKLENDEKNINEKQKKELLELINKEKKNSIKSMISNVSSSIKSKLLSSKKIILDSINRSKQIADAEEKMSDALTLLSVINGLFFAMKAQYDESMDYYERNLNKLLNNTSDTKSDLSKYEKTRYLIDYSRQYINFMVPEQLQSIIKQTINEIKSTDIQKAIDKVINDSNEQLLKVNESRQLENIVNTITD